MIRNVFAKKGNKEQKKSPSISIMSPEGASIMMVALFLDILGLIGLIPIIGQILSYIPDVLGIAVIGIWAWFRMGEMPVTKKFSKFLKRPALVMVGELIPVVGILPFWSAYVFFKLKKG